MPTVLNRMPTRPRYLRFERHQDGSGLPELLIYWRHLVRRRWLIAGSALLGGLLAFWIASQLPPVYESTSLLQVSNERERVLPIADATGHDATGTVQPELMTQAEYLQSYQLGIQVIRSLALWQAPQGTGLMQRIRNALGMSAPAPATPEEQINAYWPVFASRLQVMPLPDSHLISVSYRSADPLEAARVANAVTRTYLDAAHATRLMLNARAREELARTEQQLREQFRGSQNRLQGFRDRNGIVNLESPRPGATAPREARAGTREAARIAAQPRQDARRPGTRTATPDGAASPAWSSTIGPMEAAPSARPDPNQTLTSARIADLTMRLGAARQRRLSAENALELARSTASADLLKIPAIAADPRVADARARINRAEVLVAELGQRYGTEHPRMQAALAERSVAREILANNLRAASASLEQDVRTRANAEKLLEEELGRARGSLVQLNRNAAMLGPLERARNADQELYDMAAMRSRELGAMSGLRSDPALIIQTASPAIEPTGPDILRITLTGLLGGLFLAALGILLRDRFWLGIHNGNEAESLLGVPTLSELPAAGEHGALACLRLPPDAAFAEAVRNLRTALSFSDVDHRKHILLVSSALPGEGKSTASAAIALSFAQTGSCLLIDTDLRRAGVSEQLGLTRAAAGLSDCLAQRGPLGALPEMAPFIHTVPGSRLQVMPAGAAVKDPQELLQSDRFRLTLQQLGNEYDSIVIDTAPLSLFDDARIIAPLCTLSLLMVRANSTQYPLVRRALLQLKRAGAHVVGTVLNTGLPEPGGLHLPRLGRVGHLPRLPSHHHQVGFFAGPEAQPPVRGTDPAAAPEPDLPGISGLPEAAQPATPEAFDLPSEPLHPGSTRPRKKARKRASRAMPMPAVETIPGAGATPPETAPAAPAPRAPDIALMRDFDDGGLVTARPTPATGAQPSKPSRKKKPAAGAAGSASVSSPSPAGTPDPVQKPRPRPRSRRPRRAP